MAKVRKYPVRALTPAERTMVEDNLGLVYSFEDRHRVRGMERAEARNEYVLALMQSATSFDSARGWKFSTWAWHNLRMRRNALVQRMQRRRPLAPITPEVAINLRAASTPDALPDVAGIAGELSEREAAVVHMRYYQGMRLREVAETLKVSKQRVQQIEQKALHRMRDRLVETGVFAP
jgi:RNA polymerase sigma factor (sigma-70 family)